MCFNPSLPSVHLVFPLESVWSGIAAASGTAKPVGAFADVLSLFSANEKVPLCVHTHIESLLQNQDVPYISCFCFPKGAEGQDKEGKLPEGAGFRHGPPDRDPLCPLPAVLPAPCEPQKAMPELPPLHLQRLQPCPPRGAGLALRPLPPGQVSGGLEVKCHCWFRGQRVPLVGQVCMAVMHTCVSPTAVPRA